MNDWRGELQELAQRARRRGASSLGDDQVLKLDALTRRLAAELARARRDDPGGLEAERLNSFAAHVHGIVHAGRRTRSHVVAAFFTDDFPRCIARHLRTVGLGIGIFVTGAVLSYLFVAAWPQKAHLLLPAQLVENAEQGFRQENFEKSTKAWQAKPMYVSFYITNNTRVAFMAFAVGIAFAVPTVVVLFQNGIIMGATVALVQRNGLLPNLLGFISPHGAIELGAIFFSAAAGMLIGWALIAPGRRTRRESLKSAAHDVVVMVIGSACLLFVAAFLETFVAPLAVPNPVKYAIGAVNLALLCLYVAHGWVLERRARGAQPR